MGVLPLQFADGENPQTLGITGRETFDISGLNNNIQPGEVVKIKGDERGWK